MNPQQYTARGYAPGDMLAVYHLARESSKPRRVPQIVVGILEAPITLDYMLDTQDLRIITLSMNKNYNGKLVDPRNNVITTGISLDNIVAIERLMTRDELCKHAHNEFTRAK